MVVAKKRIFHNENGENQFGIPSDVVREITIQKALNSKNILLPLALKLDVPNKNYEVYYKYYPMDLHKLIIKQRSPLPERFIKLILHSILSGLEHMHSNRFLHWDVKSSNILVGRNEVVLSDFGMACQFSVPAIGLSSHIGTPNYRAPELVCFDEKKGYLTGVDIWALGCVIFEAMTLKNLFSSSSDELLR